MKKKKIKPFQHEGHRLVTRRDFLAQGLIAGTGYFLLPSLYTLLKTQEVYGAQCKDVLSQTTGKTPVIIFDLAGGASIAGSNVMVGKQGGQADFLSDYASLGLPPDFHPSLSGQLDNRLGLSFHADSGFVRAIMARSAAIAPQVDGAVFCSVSNDDTSNNPHNPMYWLNRAGAAGRVSQLAGTSGSQSGGRSMAPAESIDLSIAPVTVNDPDDAISLIGTGALGTLFPENKARKILKVIERMSQIKMRAFSQKSLPEQYKQVVECGYVQGQDLLTQFQPDSLDPRLDQAVTTAFDNLNDGDQQKVASIAKLVLDGHIGAGTIEKRGYDYHDGSRATGEVLDADAGDLIGRVLNLAAAKNKDVMIYVLTDGGVSSRPEIDNSQDGRGKFNWTGDNGQRAASFMLVYKQDGGRPPLRTGNRQVGHFRESGGVETEATLVSNNVTNLSKAVVANYLALHGEEGNLADVVGDDPFSGDYDKYLVFNKLR